MRLHCYELFGQERNQGTLGGERKEGGGGGGGGVPKPSAEVANNYLDPAKSIFFCLQRVFFNLVDLRHMISSVTFNYVFVSVTIIAWLY